MCVCLRVCVYVCENERVCVQEQREEMCVHVCVCVGGGVARAAEGAAASEHAPAINLQSRLAVKSRGTNMYTVAFEKKLRAAAACLPTCVSVVSHKSAHAYVEI